MATRMTAADKEFLEKEGYIVIKGVFSKEEVDEIKQEYESHWLELLSQGRIRQRMKRPYESLYPRVRDHHLKSSIVLKHILAPKVVDIAEEIIGEEALVVSTSYYFKGPGMSGMPIHQDNSALGVYPGTSLSVWISLDDSDVENGGLVFAPGTHKLELLPPKVISKDIKFQFTDEGQEVEVPDGYRLVHVSAQAGDLVIFNGNIIHGSGPNETKDRFRRALLVHFGGISVERLTLNFNHLINRQGQRVRKRLNTKPKVAETQESVFSYKVADYYKTTGWEHHKRDDLTIDAYAENASPEGKPAPDFTLPAHGATGTKRISDYRGQYVILYFYPQDHTPHCTRQACSFRDHFNVLTEKYGAQILGISTDSVETHEEFAAKHQLPFPLLADTDHKVAEMYGVWGEETFRGNRFMSIKRSTFIINPDGIVEHALYDVKVNKHVEEVIALLEQSRRGENSHEIKISEC